MNPNNIFKLLYKLLIFIFFTFSVTIGFSQSANVLKGCLPLEVNFKAETSFSSYYWDFKDGVTSNLENPSNVFTKAGTYEVTFSEKSTSKIIKTIQIVVFAAPQLKVQAIDPKGCLPHTTSFENITEIDPSIKINNTIWVWGDGTSSQGIDKPSRTYTALGKYDLSFSLETEFSTCNKTAVFKDVVDVVKAPTASFSTDPTNLITCQPPLVVNFTNQSSGDDLIYAWDFGNGNVSSSASPNSQTYHKEGQYTSLLSVSYSFGCKTSFSRNITIGKPVAKIEIEKDTTCLKENLSFSSKNSGLLMWEFGDNANPKTAIGNSVSTQFLTKGFHTIQLIVTAPGGTCSDTTTKQIYVDEVILSVLSTPEYSCENRTQLGYTVTTNIIDPEILWTLKDTTFKDVLSVQYDYFYATDTLNYGINEKEVLNTSIVVTSPLTKCSATENIEHIIWFPNAELIPDIAKGCAPLNVAFNDTSVFDPDNEIVSWEWVYGDGQSIKNSTDADVSHTYTQDGDYDAFLVITNKLGCVDTSYSVHIEVGKDISNEVDFTVSPTEVCPSEAVTFSLKSNSTKLDEWHFSSDENKVFHCSKDSVVNWKYKGAAQKHDVHLIMDYNGCFSKITKSDIVTVKGVALNVDYLALCNDPLNYSFTSTTAPIATVSWDFGDGTTSSLENDSHTYLTSGEYRVIATAIDPTSVCENTIDTFLVKPTDIQSIIALDTLLCINSKYVLDASKSIDVFNKYHKGYTWSFPTLPKKRPYTTDTFKLEFSFDTSGIHIVELITEDLNGCKDTASVKVNVYDMEIKGIASKQRICTPATLDFTDQSIADTTLMSWSWTFGDGKTSTEQNPTHTYEKMFTNSLNVGLTVKDSLGCQESFNFNISHYSPTSTISISDRTLCLGDSTVLTASDYTTDGSNLDFSWDFGNSITSKEQSNKFLYSQEGNYQVKLDFKEIATGCTGSSSSTISVQAYPIASIDVNTDTLSILCNPQNMIFKDNSVSNSSLQHYWDFGNGTKTFNSNYSLLYSKGTWNTEHIVKTSNGCADTVKRVFDVVGPEGTFDINKNLICKGEGIQFTIKDTVDVWKYKWAFGDGIITANQSPINHLYNFHPPSGQTFARLIMEGKDGSCPTEVEKAINIYQVIADFNRLDGLDSVLCTSEGAYSFTNVATLADDYTWNFGDGETTVSTASLLEHQYAKAGTYFVSLKINNDALGCTDSIAKQVVIYDNPIVESINDTICIATNAQISVKTPREKSIYQWMIDNTLSEDTTASFSLAGLIQNTSIIVTEKDTNNCFATDTSEIFVIKPSNFNDLDTIIVIGDVVKLPVSGSNVYNFKWSPITNLSCVDCDYPIVRPLEDIIYNLEVTDVRNCFEDFNIFNIKVKPETFIKMPTTFSPNQDKTNDLLYVKGWGIKELINYEIYNRWGQLIYSSNNIDEGWDGTYQGNNQNSDVYTYRIKVSTWKDEELYKEGYINLIH